MLLEKAALKFPSRPSLLWTSETESLEISYEKLWLWSKLVASEITTRLKQVDVDIGKELVALAIDEGPVLVIAVASCWIAGAVIMPLSMEETPERLVAIIKDTKPRLILSTSNKIVNNVWSTISDSTLRAPLDIQTVTQTEEAYIWFTSGSSGTPKGCIINHKALLSYAKARNEVHQIEETPQARVMMASAMTFDPFLGDIVSCWLSGACLCMAERFTVASDLGGCLSRSEATHVCTTPSIFTSLSSEGWTPAMLPHLRTVALGGEMCDGSVIDTWGRADNGRVRLLNTYGVTEVTVYQLVAELAPTRLHGSEVNHSISIPISSDPSCCGVPLSGVLLWVVDPLTLMPTTGLGEIVLGGVQVAKGYLRREALSGEKFIGRNDEIMGNPLGSEDSEASLLYRTGDMGRLIDGKLHIQGRMDDGQMKCHGRRIEAGEVEHAMMMINKIVNYPIIATCAALVVDDRLTVVVVLISNTHELNRQIKEENVIFHEDFSLALRSLCSKVVPNYLVPSQVVFTHSLPSTQSGKLYRQQLPQLFSNICYNTQSIKEISSLNSIKQRERSWVLDLVCQVWESVLTLQVGTCDVSRSFISLGGDSLNALRGSRLLTRMLFEIIINLKKEGCVHSSDSSDGVDSSGVDNGIFGVSAGDLNGVTLSEALGSDTGEIPGLLNPRVMLFGEEGGDGPSAEQYASKIESVIPADILTLHRMKMDDTSTLKEVASEGPEQLDMDMANFDFPPMNNHPEDAITAAFWRAIVVGDDLLVRCLIALGVSPDASTSDLVVDNVMSAKHELPVVGTVIKIVEAGGSGGSRKVGKRSALHIAASNNKESVIRLLLQAGAAVRGTDSGGRMAAHIAAASGYSDILALLLDHRPFQDVTKGTPLFAKDLNKQTLLHFASRSGNVDTVSVVLDRWLKVHPPSSSVQILDFMDRWHRTPVYWCILNQHLECLRLLLSHGASPDPPLPTPAKHAKRTSLRLETPLELARRLPTAGSEEVNAFEEALLTAMHS